MFYAALGGVQHFCLSLQLILYLIQFMELQEVF